jgi:hypothetical protein
LRSTGRVDKFRTTSADGCGALLTAPVPCGCVSRIRTCTARPVSAVVTSAGVLTTVAALTATTGRPPARSTALASTLRFTT